MLTFTANIFAQVTLESSNLPIVIINTGGQEIPNSYKITADMGIIYNSPGQRNYVTDSLNNYSGKIGIELRGSSSQMFPKKQFAVETRDEIGENLNVPLLGLPQENDWILYAPYSDKSLMRNVLLYHLSNQIGRYASRSRYCELILNGNYRGVYVLFEKIKRDDNRVNISRLDSSDVSGDDLTGGYIIKIDKKDGEEVNGWYSPFRPTDSNLFKIYYQYHYPRPDDILEEQKSYIESYINEFENLISGWEYDNPDIGYANMIDVPSFVDFFLLNEISKNVDGYRLSTFYYKDRNSDDPDLYIGPVWDFNLAFGNANYYDGWKTDGWQVEINRLSSFEYDYAKIPFYWERFMNDRSFVLQVVDRWFELRLTKFNVDSINAYIDDTVDYLDEAQQRNFTRWDILGEYVWPNFAVNGTYENEIMWLKGWIGQRLGWMDKMLLDTIPPSTIENLRITGTTNSSISIAWDTGSDNNLISGYDVFLDGDKVKYSLLPSCKIDENTETKEYQIEVKARDYAGNYSVGNPILSVVFTDISDKGRKMPHKFMLHQNYPNPFNPVTIISWQLAVSSYVDLSIYNTLGKKVATLVNKKQPEGNYKVNWNASDFPSGIYYCKFKSKSYQKSMKMILLK